MSMVRKVAAELPRWCAGLFARDESRRLAGETVIGLQADLKTENSWCGSKPAKAMGPSPIQ